MNPVSHLASRVDAGLHAIAVRLAHLGDALAKLGPEFVGVRNVARDGRFLVHVPTGRAQAFVEAARSDNPTFSRFKPSALAHVVNALRNGGDFGNVLAAAASVCPEKWSRYPTALAMLVDAVPAPYRTQVADLGSLPASAEGAAGKGGHLFVPRLGVDTAELLAHHAATRMLDNKMPYPVILASAQDRAAFETGLAQLHRQAAKNMRLWRIEAALSKLSTEMKPDPALWVKLKATHAATAPGRIPVLDARALQGLHATEGKLYVVGHGYAGLDGIGVFQRGKAVVASSEELANQLRDAGLKPEHRDVRLWACEGACPGEDGSPANAQRFADALARAGFTDVEVAAYPGVLRLFDEPGPDGKWHRTIVTESDAGETVVKAGTVRQVFHPRTSDMSPAS
jgi:hypothetical protein